MVLERAQQIAWDLSQKYGPQPVAWVEFNGSIYYAVLNKGAELPATVVTQLIQYLFDKYVDHSFFILRQRIFTTERLTDLCHAMIKLTAKRGSGDIIALDHRIKLESQWECLASSGDPILRSQFSQDQFKKFGQKLELTEASRFLNQLLCDIERGDVLHDYNRQIACVLCDADNRVLELAINNNSKNKTLHAEVCLVQNYYQRTGNKMPVGAKIYSSLKPCKMCAEMILKYSTDPGAIKVFYQQDDPGRLAKDTALENKGLLYPLSES